MKLKHRSSCVSRQQLGSRWLSLGRSRLPLIPKNISGCSYERISASGAQVYLQTDIWNGCCAANTEEDDLAIQGVGPDVADHQSGYQQEGGSVLPLCRYGPHCAIPDGRVQGAAVACFVFQVVVEICSNDISILPIKQVCLYHCLGHA